MKKNRDQPSKTFFEYRRMINYFMTVFFIFLLMVSILLFINLSRTVLSDSNIEKHLSDTKSLLEELEEVEKSGSNKFANFSSNFSDYPQKNLINRLDIEDISLFDTNKSEVAYLTLKSSEYRYKTIDSSIIIINIEPELYDMIIFRDETSNFQRGLIIDLYDESEGRTPLNENDELGGDMYIILKDTAFNVVNTELNQSLENPDQNINDKIMTISRNDIEGVELISN